MKTTRRMAAVLAVVLAAGSVLAGCGNKTVTAESLMQDAQKKIQKVDSVEGGMVMEMQMGLDEESGISMDMGINMDMDMELLNDPMMYHMKGTMSIDLLDGAVDMEMYGEQDGDSVVSYLKMDDEWQKQTVEVDEEDNGSIINMGESLMDADNCELAEKLEKVNGKEAYVITAKLDGEDFSETMKEMEGVLQGTDSLTGGGEMDFSKMTADVTYKIYKDTNLPAEISITAQGGDEPIMELEGIGIMMNKIAYTISFEKFDKVEKITIPEEAKNAEEIEEVTE